MGLFTKRTTKDEEHLLDDPNAWVCGTCRHLIEDHSDLYCRFCGAPTSKRLQNPKTYVSPCDWAGRYLYAYRQYSCPSCLHSYTTHAMAPDDRFCPRCSHEIQVEVADPPTLPTDEDRPLDLSDLRYTPKK